MALTLEEKYDEVRTGITMGKEKGYLLYEEVNEMLPTDIHTSDELEDVFAMFGSMGIEIIDSEQKFREKSDAEEGETIDLTPGTLDKTNDPVRMYLREMGTVPLLTREGEVAIAKRIERGKRIMLAQITRTPMAAREILAAGEQLEASRIGVKELVIFVEEEITEEKLERKKRETLKLVANVKAAFDGYLTLKAKYEDTTSASLSRRPSAASNLPKT
jgi:RNA polymerase primary sigma factor